MRYGKFRWRERLEVDEGGKEGETHHPVVASEPTVMRMCTQSEISDGTGV